MEFRTTAIAIVVVFAGVPRSKKVIPPPVRCRREMKQCNSGRQLTGVQQALLPLALGAEAAGDAPGADENKGSSNYYR